jgi:hypothetical protein
MKIKVLISVVLTLLCTLLLMATRGYTAEPKPTSVVNNRFVRPDGANLFLLGTNYVGGADRSWTMWEDGKFDAKLIEQDFLKAKAAGVNTIRLFIRPPLQQEVLAGRTEKLDAVVALAEKHNLYLIVTLYDYREDDLSKAVAPGKIIAQRYTDRSVILAYDLKNEPHYQDLAIARYPGSLPGLQTDVLIRQYGERLNMAEVNTWRQVGDGKAMTPSRFSDQEAYIYANNYRIYLDFLKDAGDWVAARGYEVTTLDFFASPDGAKWKLLRDVLDQTLAAWLAPQLDAILASDKEHLTTVGYSDAILASLPANNRLGFVSLHRFTDANPKALGYAFNLLRGIRQAFPNKALVFEEFGYSNDANDPSLSSIYETLVWLRLMNEGMAGGAKWSLHDVLQGWDARESNFGIYRTDGSAKPIALAMRALGEYSGSRPIPVGKLETQAGGGASTLQYTYSAPDALFVAASSYTDPSGRLRFEAKEVAQVFLSWPRGNVIDVATTAASKINLNPRMLLGVKSVGDLLPQKANGVPIAFQRMGDNVIFDTEAGQSYRFILTSPGIDARIEIAWPQGNKPVREAERANIGAYLFHREMSTIVCPELISIVRLWRSLNNGVEEPVAVGKRRMVSANGLVFTQWDFNDVDVSAAKDPGNKYYLRLSIDGYASHSNIWSHGEDARTFVPQPDLPDSVTDSTPKEVDGKIEIVWPLDNLPVEKATKVNVGANLFQRGTLHSVPADWSPTVRLWRALNNGVEEQISTGQKVIKKAGALSFPVWEFNDVDVSASQDARNKYYFRLTIDGVDSRSNVWSHASDARTNFPEMDRPSGVGACN